LNKPVVAVSACLLGQPVRYDGSGKPDAFIMGELAASATIIPVCPEMAIGMGAPRPKIQVVFTPGGNRAVGVEHQEMDVTLALRGYARQFLRDHPAISGMVLKSRSPSCGVGNTPLFDTTGEVVGLASGLFAATVMALRPALPVIDETTLPQAAEHFLQRSLSLK